MDELATTNQPSVSVFDTIMSLAPVMHRARLFGTNSEEQAAAIMLKGHEIGLGLAQSFEFVQVIQGKPSLIPRGALALVHMSGELEDFKIIEKNDDKGNPFSCTVKGRRGSFSYETTFTMDDARRAGLTKKDGAYDKYPANMVKWRAIGFWIDVVFPDTQGGMKRADEFGAWVDERGEIIDAEVTPVLSIDSLITEYGVNKVMDLITATFDGNMPNTQEDLETLEEALKQSE